MHADPTPPPQGFYAVICTPAPIEDGTDLLDEVRRVVRRARGAVLVSSATAGPPGMVWVTRRRPDGQAAPPIDWFGPIRTTTDAEHLCDWLAIGGPLAPMPEALQALRTTAAATRTSAAPLPPRERPGDWRTGGDNRASSLIP